MVVKIYKPILYGLLAGAGYCFFWGFYLGIDKTNLSTLQKDLMMLTGLTGYSALYARHKLGVKFRYLIWAMAFVASAIMAVYTYCVFYRILFFQDGADNSG